MKLIDRSLGLFFLACLASHSAMAQESKPILEGQPFLNNASLKQTKRTLSMMSTVPAETLAEKMGITDIQAKDISRLERAGKPEPSLPGFADRAVGDDPAIHENEPSIAVKPNQPHIIIAVSHRIGAGPNGITIGAFRSFDGGETWSEPIDLPTRFNTDTVSDPVVRWAPNGRYVYAAYMSIRSDSSTADIVVTRSANNGATWSTPIVAVPGGDYDFDGTLDFPDKPWLDVHPFATTSKARRAIYVTTTLLDADGDIHILATRSLNQGRSFLSSPIFLTTATAGSGVVLQGSRPIGGQANEVLACWYNSETDGWLNGVFDIRCKRSADNGLIWGGESVAVNDMLHELPFWLGPFEAYHRWWLGMAPSMTVTPDGTVHMVFTADPIAGSENAEDGDVYYVRSPRPHGSWSRATRISDDDSEKAQGYPTITAKRITGGSILFAAWEDHRTSSFDNEFYDIFSDKTLPAFGEDSRVSDISSISDFIFIGDYIDSSASRRNDRLAHVIWTDRSDKLDIFDPEDDTFSDAVELE